MSDHESEQRAHGLQRTLCPTCRWPIDETRAFEPDRLTAPCLNQRCTTMYVKRESVDAPWQVDESVPQRDEPA
jgi:hypothetical protein